MYSFEFVKHPKILYEKSSNEKGGNLDEAKKNEDPRYSKETAQKWGIDITSFIFPDDGNQNKTKELLDQKIKELQASGIDTKQKHYKTILDEIRLFSQDIFDKKGNYKPNAKDGIEKLRTAIGIEGNNSIKEVDKILEKRAEEKKEAQELIKQYPIVDFKKFIFEQCVKHPFITKTWVFFNEYEKLKGKVIRLGKNLPPEYSAVIGTMDQIMKDEKFGKYTGKFSEKYQKDQGNEKVVKAFQANLSIFLDMAIAQKKPLSMTDFNNRFDENKELTNQEKEFVKKYVDGVIIKIKQDKYPTKEAKKQRLQEYIDVNKKDPKLNANVVRNIEILLQGIQSQVEQGTDGSIFGELKDVFTGKGDKREIANKDATEKTLATKTRHFVGFTDGEFRAISINELKNAMLNDVSKELNIGAFTGLLGIADWQKVLIDEFGIRAIASVGAYLSKNPSTRLFQGANEKAKGFFLDTYKSISKTHTDLINTINSPLKGNFKDLFPSLANNSKIDEKIEKLILDKNIKEAYDILAEKGATNGEIRGIMEGIEKDAGILKNKGLSKNLEWAKIFGNKKVSEISNQFNLTDAKNQKEFKKFESKIFMGGSLTDDEKKFLLTIVKEGTDAKKALENQLEVENTGNLQGSANQAKQNAAKQNPNSRAQKLDSKTSEKIDIGGKVVVSEVKSRMSIDEAKQNVIGFSDLKNDSERFNKLASLEALQAKGKLSETEAQLLVTLTEWKNKQQKKADDLTSFSNIAGRESAAKLVQDTFDVEISQAQALQYVDSQRFISTYIGEKNFIEVLEKNSAYMNTSDIKNVGQLYNENGKVDISRMNSDTGNITLNATNIPLSNSFAGINELMQCQVSIGSDGNYFNRTIRDPQGKIIAENIPLQNLEGTINQLGRFYALGLGDLAPFMKEINSSIGKSRGDKISGLDGSFDMTEDKKFLKIFATMLYGENSIPEDGNINGMITLFNRAGTEFDPKRILKQKGIINEDGNINISKLDLHLQESSKKVI